MMTIRVYRVNHATGERKKLFKRSASVDSKARDRVVVSEVWPPCGCRQCRHGEATR
jgi:hypothetical protein